jgi:hypothetical protein
MAEAFKGIAESIKHRTPRQRALEIGTNPEGFKAAPNYDSRGGHPIDKDHPVCNYAENVKPPTASGGKSHDPSPFTIKK